MIPNVLSNFLGTPRHAFSMCINSSNGNIYVTGGWTHGHKCIGTFETLKYSNEMKTSSKSSIHATNNSKKWEVCSPMIMPRRLHGSAYYDNKIYVFGGSPGNNLEQKLRTNCVEYHDLSTQLWSRLNDMPCKSHCVACTVGHFIYILPFGDEGIFKYNPSNDTYSQSLGKLPLTNWHGFSVTHNEEYDVNGLYVVGGASNAKWSSKVFRYDVITNVWNELNNMLLPRRRTACAIALSK